MFGSKRILGGAAGPSRRMAIAAMCTGALLLSACGQRGPLYLPPPKPATEKPADQTPRPAPAPPAQR
ncbi:lipoprotein [Hydrogenophaga sp. 2FB]|uniref:LPS translocon maturation chaperone LptM n=1 Tax=Hydrogenophaga sp. 2FB TaxID=2502187 RepID=UPI0010F491F1